MSTKIRLQRHGRRNYAFYHIVIADSRAPRNGKFIERIGIYNPNTNPATIKLKFDRALYWLNVGAQPTNTTKNILSNEGVLLKKHLLEGVKKGAILEKDMENKFVTWQNAKNTTFQSKINKIQKQKKNIDAVNLEIKKTD